MRNATSIAAILFFCGSAASVSAQVFENFEHGNEALWIDSGTGGDNMNLNAASAHAGNFGAEFISAGASFRYRTDLATTPGNKYIAHVRSRGGAAGGRFYFGVGAGAGGAYSAVFGVNTGTIILQDNTAWGFNELATASFTPAADTWYVLMLDWAFDGTMTVSVWDDLLLTQLATTAPVATGFTTPGGVSIRGFTNSATVFQDADDLGTPGPTGPTGACCITATGACYNGVSSANCVAAGGVYQGDNSNCGTVSCPQPPTGACCLDTGCVVLTSAQCATQGGVYQGNSTACATANCPPPTAWQEHDDAGDLPATAQVTSGTGSLNTIRGGLTAGDVDMYLITICDANAFTATISGSISDTQIFLFDSTGKGVAMNDDSPLGAGLQSALAPAGAIPGLTNGVYYIAISSYDNDPNDSAAQALWLDTPFNTVRAPDGAGAANPVAAWDAAGSNTGNYSIALTGACFGGGTGPSGACCISATGACITSTQSGCTSLGGVYQGNGSVCGSVVCPQPPTGSCCLTDGSCAQLTSANCASVGGVFGGNGTTCATAPCTAVCYSATGLGIAIPDGGALQNGSAGPDAVATLNVSGSGTITSITAKVNITHTWQGDIRFKLVHPDGTEVVLVNRPGVPQPKQSEPPNPAIVGFGFTTDNYGSSSQPMVFKDGAAAGVYDDANGGGTAVATNNVIGLWAPVGSLASLNGKPIAGDWKLVANDYAGGDTGTISSYSICIATQGGASCYANCDNSTIAPCLNVNDYVCFNNAFSAGSAYANCDGSTITPVLNVNDYVCFNNKFSAGCATPCSPHP